MDRIAGVTSLKLRQFRFDPDPRNRNETATADGIVRSIGVVAMRKIL